MHTVHEPMECCGLMTAEDLEWALPSDFEEIKVEARDTVRTCVLIVLTEHQKKALENAKDAGFTEIHSFTNKRSGNLCYILQWTDA